MTTTNKPSVIKNGKKLVYAGNDFESMVGREKSKVIKARSHKIPALNKINICVRKRPLLRKEENKGEFDIVS